MGALRFDGVNDVVSIATAMTGNAGTSAYTMRVKSGPSGITLPASGLAAFIGTSSNTNQTGLMTNSAGRVMIYTGATLRYGSANGFLQSGVPFDFTLTHNADGTWNFFDNINFVTNSSGTFSTNTLFGNLNYFGRASSNNATHLQGDIEIIEVTGLANAQSWQADLSNGTGSTWPTASGTNQGSLVNFPTDNSQWVGFAVAAALEAAASAVASVTAALTTAIRFAAAATAIAASTAGLTTQIQLQAAPTGTATVTTSLSTAIRMQAAPAAIASATADLTAGSSGISANAQALSTATAQLTTQIRFQATPAAQASSTANLTTAIRLAATPAAVATATASLTTGSAGMAANSQAVASVSAVLTTSIRLQASAASNTIASADLSLAAAPLQASAYAVSSCTASLLTQIQLQTIAQASATASATLGDVDTSYQPDPDRLTYVFRETRISAIFGQQRITVVS